MRQSNEPLRYPPAEIIGAILLLAWCVGFGWWLTTALQAMG